MEKLTRQQDATTAFAIARITLLSFKLGSSDDNCVRSVAVIPKHGPTKRLSSSLLTT